eukprot:Opistho-1_new@42543
MDAALKRPVAPKDSGILTNAQLAAAAASTGGAPMGGAFPGPLGMADPASLVALELQMQSAAAYGLLDGFLDPNLDIFNPAANPLGFGGVPPVGLPLPLGMGLSPEAIYAQMQLNQQLQLQSLAQGAAAGLEASSVSMPIPIPGVQVKQEDFTLSPPGDTSIDDLMLSIQSLRNGSCESPNDGYVTESSDRRDSFSAEPSPSEFGDGSQAAAVRRSAHIAAEQKRHNNIKEGFDQLQHMIPACRRSPSSKVSKATVLRKAVDYIAHMIREKSSLVEEVGRLRKEVCQLRLIIKHFQQYGQLSDADMKAIAAAAGAGPLAPASNAPVRPGGAPGSAAPNPNFLAENVKFYIFCSVVDNLFESFNSMVSLDSPEAFSTSLMAWFDQYCRPESLRESFLVALRMLGSRFFTEDSINRVKRWSGGLSACTESLSCKLEYMNVPMVQRIGETITSVVTMFNGAGGRRSSVGGAPGQPSDAQPQALPDAQKAAQQPQPMPSPPVLAMNPNPFAALGQPLTPAQAQQQQQAMAAALAAGLHGFPQPPRV